MSTTILTKAPADVLDYDFDFSRWMPSGDRITNAIASLAGTGAIVTDVEWSDLVARIWLSGGANDEAGILAILITTHAGRTKEVTASVRIREDA
jgi:hypothetical protein